MPKDTVHGHIAVSGVFIRPADARRFCNLSYIRLLADILGPVSFSENPSNDVRPRVGNAEGSFLPPPNNSQLEPVYPNLQNHALPSFCEESATADVDEMNGICQSSTIGGGFWLAVCLNAIKHDRDLSIAAVMLILVELWSEPQPG